MCFICVMVNSEPGEYVRKIIFQTVSVELFFSLPVRQSAFFLLKIIFPLATYHLI